MCIHTLKGDTSIKIPCKMWTRRKGRLYLVVFVFSICCLFGYMYTGIRLFLMQFTNTLRTIKKTKKVIFIVGPGRTGTTLLGELFNKESNIIYIFEPLRAVQTYQEYDIFPRSTQKAERLYAKEAMELLKDIVSCKYRERNNKYLNLLDENKQFRQKSRKLSNPPFCNDDNKQKECLPINSSTMNRMCQLWHTNDQDRIIVIKELSFRMPYTDMTVLADLEPQEEEVYDINFLYSIRDPRAFLESKRRLNWFGHGQLNPYKSTQPFVEKTCEVLKQSLQSLETKSRENQLKYKIFRFEDLEFGKLSHLEESLEKFLGLSQNLSTEEFFAKMTRRKNKFAFGSFFSTNPRDIYFINNKWRLTTDNDLVDMIQSSCKHVMNLLGYRTVSNELELRNISNVLVSKPKILENFISYS